MMLPSGSVKMPSWPLHHPFSYALAAQAHTLWGPLPLHQSPSSPGRSSPIGSFAVETAPIAPLPPSDSLSCTWLLLLAPSPASLPVKVVSLDVL
jgi:hypothetical protein